jgi:ComF family protein
MNLTFKSGIKNAFFNLKWTCNLCGEENFTNGYFCESCKQKLPKIDENHCAHCGRKTRYPALYCDSCIENNLNFDKAVSLYDYDGEIVKLLLNQKYKDKPYLTEIFTDGFKDKFYLHFADTDVITYVSMSDERLREREYNQSMLLAKNLASAVDKPLSAVFEKVKETNRQATLSLAERMQNLKGSFKVVKNVEGKNVLIVDDVLTTGATCDLLASLLKHKKAKRVYVMTVASVTKMDKNL